MSQICKKEIVEAGVRFDFANGETLMVRVDAMPEHIMQHAAKHGLSQKIGDSYAGAMSIEEAIANARQVLQQLEGGNWNAGRSSTSTGGVWIEALAAASEKELGEVVAWWNAKDADERKKLMKSFRKDVRVKSHHARITAERAAEALARAQANATDAEPLSLDSL